MEKYFIQNDYTGYLVQIFEVGFTGISTEIFGKVSFDKGNVDNILDTIRGTGLNLQLEANPLLTFEEFSDADERTYTVVVKKGNQIVFNGFLKPDGVTQSFVRDIWVVDLDFIDGLGTLKELAFVKSNGFNFTGKISCFEVIEACLARTGIVMTINTFVDVHYLDYVGTNILKDTYVNAERFFKIDDDTIMSCEEVINSILNLFSACITQQDGQWWIYRPNDFVTNTVTFTDNTLNTTFVKNLYKKIGSQIDNFYPHHCGGNQQIQTKGAISAYRINYKYGFLDGFVTNKSLVHNGFMIFEDWTVLKPSLIINDPLDIQGVLMNGAFIFGSPIYEEVLRSKEYIVNNAAIIQLTARLWAEKSSNQFAFKIKTNTGYYLKNNGEWTLTDTVFGTTMGQSGAENITDKFTFTSQPTLSAGTFHIVICQPKNGNNTLTEITYLDVTDVTIKTEGKEGEFHTVSRVVAPSSITKENQEVYNGDGDFSLIGSLFKPDKITNTTLWTRKGKLEEKPLLRISAEDDMRIQQKPIKVFSGDIYGYVPYLSIIEINNISGKFMFIEYSYDTDSNITRGKLQQFYTSEVADLNYLLTFDYGNTVKPTIVS